MIQRGESWSGHDPENVLFRGGSDYLVIYQMKEERPQNGSGQKDRQTSEQVDTERLAKDRGIFPSRQSPEVGVVQGIYTMLPRGILLIHVFLGHIAVLRFGNFIANDFTEWCNLSFA